ncbi:MAG: HAMP domain-containing histidine kinase [Gemmatimonadaceae bacterium]|nr:HAMP domain-containing histidine kinase [Gloeobacterales cyanobacterium ES-bin-141]
MKKVAVLIEQSFYVAIQWCLKHQSSTVLVILLAVVVPIGILNLLQYQSMEEYQKQGNQAMRGQLNYILNRLVLEFRDGMIKDGQSVFHAVDEKHIALLGPDPGAPQHILNQIQTGLIKEDNKLKSAYRLEAFMLIPDSRQQWTAIFPDSATNVQRKAAIVRARNYFLTLSPVERDVGYLFFPDFATGEIMLMHTITGELPASYTRTPPKPIKFIMGMAIPKQAYTREDFDSLTRRSQVTRFNPGLSNASASGADYYFQVKDERGNVLFSDRQDWEELSRCEEHISSQITITEGQKFITGWQLAVLTQNPLKRITDRSLWQMLGVSAFMAVNLFVLLAIIFKASLVAVKVADMKSDILAGVSHDLKTPLAGIIASAQLLATGRASGPDETRQFSGYIVAEARRLTETVEKVLTLVKLESQQMQMKTSVISIPELIERAIEPVSRAFPDAVISKGNIPQGAIRADYQALTTVLMNLLDNAVRYSKGQAQVKIQAHWSQHGDKRILQLQVEDKGIGIAVDEQPFVFQKFYRVRNGLVTDTEGTGLGLAIAAQIIRAHSGHIHLHSQVGVGSKFTVSIPDERSHSGS